jgi:16S rRNA (guanine527-N7)-methyltransferase
VNDSGRQFERRLDEQARKAGIEVPQAISSQLERYYRLLSKWNSRINLTALPLEGYRDATLDKLFIEPILCAELLDSGPGVWFDLGSGGGSPAIPMKLARPAKSLTMVDSNARKTAFLREVIHALRLQAAQVATERIESLPATCGSGTVDVITIRAVRLDDTVSRVCAHLLRIGGRLLTLGSSFDALPKSFRLSDERPLISDSTYVWERL